MSDELRNASQHRHVYVPRGTDTDTLSLGKRLGIAVARERRTHLTVLSPQKNGATHHPELAKLSVVTERTGWVPDGGVVLAWCPRHKTMEKLQHLVSSAIVLVEWVPGQMAAWAGLHRAYNVVTGQVMESGLGAEAVGLLEAIVAEGYNGWTKSSDVAITTGYLQELSRIGAYDRDVVLAFVRQSKRESSVQRLSRTLDAFDKSTGEPTARRWVL